MNTYILIQTGKIEKKKPKEDFIIGVNIDKNSRNKNKLKNCILSL